MTLERLERKDVRLLIACAVVGAVCLFFGVKYYFRAFPEASIEFRVTKDGSLPGAESFLRGMGLDPAGYRHAAVFGYDDQAKTFLERETDLATRNRLLDSTVRLWRWRHRWFQPLRKEELQVEVTTRGEPVGFQHLLPDEAPGENLPQEEARRIAERFLSGTMVRPLDGLGFVEGSTEKKPARTDHSFTWKVNGSDVKGADYRIDVRVAGSGVAAYREYLKIPDTWARDYQKLRSRNELASQVDMVFLFLTVAAMVVMCALRIRRGDVRWRTAVVFGGVTFVLMAVSQVNQFPSTLYGYQTTASFSGFLLRVVLQAIGVGIAAGALILVVTASAEPFYRERFPRFLSLSSYLRPRALRSKEFLLSTAVGLALTAFFFAYENAFYLIAHSLGAWSPREVPYDDLLSTAIPWVFVLFFGWLPAISEEFISRMFSIPFFERLFRSTAFAVVLQAFIWGFGHAGYPNQPFWIRGLEVGLAGVVFGIVMLRFGILAVVVCHFSVDALYSAFVLLRSHDPYSVVTGALSAGIFAVLFLIALGLYIGKKGFVPADVTNEAEGIAPPVAPHPAEEPSTEVPSYMPIARRTIAIGIVVAVILAVLRFVPVTSFGDWVEFRTTRAQAKTIAADFLRNQGFDVSSCRSSVVPLDRTDPTAAAYLLETGGMESARTFWRDRVPTPLWRVRFFVPGQHEEYAVSVDPATATVVGFTRTLPEDAPGPTLPGEESRAVAEAFLRARGLDPATGDWKEQTEKDEKARRDTTIVWGFPVPGAGEAESRVRVVVQGGAVGSWTREAWIPEEWRRDREKETALTTILGWLFLPFLLVVAGFAILLLVRTIRAGAFRWKLGLLAGAIAGAGLLLRASLSLDTFWDRYQTSMPGEAYVVMIAISLLIATLAIFLAGGVVTGLARGLFPGATCKPAAADRPLVARDAAVAGIVSFGLVLGLPALVGFLERLVPSATVITVAGLPDHVSSRLPFLSAVGGTAFGATFLVALLAVGIALLTGPFRSPVARVLLAVFFLLSFLPSGARTLPEYLFGALASALYAAAVLLLVRFFLRGNLLAWVWSALFALATDSAIELLQQPAVVYRWNGAILLAVVILGGAWLLRDAFRRPGGAPG